MSAPAVRLPARSRPGVRVTQARVIRSEWTKLWTLRSTRLSLLAAVVAMIGLPIGIAAVQMSRWSHLDPHDRLTFDSINTAVNGYQIAQLAIGVLGVLVITGEYSTGMIKATFGAVPKRLPVIWAKLVVFCTAVFVLMLVAAFVAFFATQPIVHQHGLDKTLAAPHALRAVIGAALYLTALGALGVGLGTLVRNTAGGIAAFVGLLFVLPGITALLPASIADTVDKYLPLNAGSAVLTSRFEPHPHLGPWVGFGVFCAYTMVVIAAAAVLTVRRDA